MAGADPTGGAAGAGWTQASAAAPQYPKIAAEWDVPITMSDGTVLKTNVYRPANAQGHPIGEKTPVIVNMTPYTKMISALAAVAIADPTLGPIVANLASYLNFTGTPLDGITELAKTSRGGIIENFAVNPDLVRNGYTQIVVDVRGTGFSQGEWQALGPLEQQDTGEVIDWASKQNWSDGRVGTSGVSYSAINQIQAASKRPEALKAVFAVEPSNDLLHDIVGTGGALGIGFMPMWLGLVNGFKWLPDMQALLQGNFDAKWLSDRMGDPTTLIPELVGAVTTPSVDALPAKTKGVMQDGPFFTERQTDVSQINVPTFVYGGWHDIFANSEPDVYNDLELPVGQKQLMMGDGYHTIVGKDFGTPGYPPTLAVMERAWFDKWIKGIDNGIDKYGPVTLMQQGGGWTTADQFPRAGTEYQRLYLSGAPSGTAGHARHDGSLGSSAPSEPATFTVAPGLRGVCSREGNQGTAGLVTVLGSACTTDARFNEAEGLTFTSPPVTEPTQISGPMNMHLNTVLDAPDGFWSVSINDVAPDGRSTVISSGSLVTSMRAVDEANSTRTPSGDYADIRYELTLDKRAPVVPGQPTELDIALIATDSVLQPGHRLRVDVYAFNVARSLPLGPTLADGQLRPQHLKLDPAAPSFVNIPVVGRSTW